MKHFTRLLLLSLMLFAVSTLSAQEERKQLTANADQQPISLTISGTSIHIQNADKGDTLEVYNILGVKLLSIKIDTPDKSIPLTLPKGCYILKIENIVRKIAIK
ncbi:MAG: T9SS type A sorting domain-containing protein [Bacteroidaceae bacterium]